MLVVLLGFGMSAGVLALALIAVRHVAVALRGAVARGWRFRKGRSGALVMPRVWSRGDRVVYEPDPMLYGVMTVAEGNGAGGSPDLVLCRAFNAPRRDSFDLFDADVLVEAPVTEPVPEPEPVTQPGLPEGGKK